MASATKSKRVKLQLNSVRQEIRAWLLTVQRAKSAQQTVRTISRSNLGEFGKMWFGEGVHVELGRADSLKYDRLMRQLRCAVGHVPNPDLSLLGERFADRLMRESVEAVVDIADPDQRRVAVNKAVELLCEAVSKIRGYSVLVPVAGLDKRGFPFEIGDVNFIVPDREFIGQLDGRMGEITSSLLNPPDQRAQLHASHRRKLHKYYLEAPLAQVRVLAVDGQASVRMALEAVSLALDVVNFLADTQSVHDRSFAYLVGHAAHNPVPVISIDSTCQPSQLEVANGAVGITYAIDPREFRRNADCRSWYERASSLIRERGLNQVADRIVAAMRWAGKARAASQPASALLNYTISLEALLLESSAVGELKERLGWRVAHLIGKTPDARLRIRSRVGELYGLRSKTVHNGVVDISSEDVASARFYSLNCLARVLELEDLHGAESEKEFLDWFDRTLAGEDRFAADEE